MPSDLSANEDSPYVPAANEATPGLPSPTEETSLIASPNGDFLTDNERSVLNCNMAGTAGVVKEAVVIIMVRLGVNAWC